MRGGEEHMRVRWGCSGQGWNGTSVTIGCAHICSLNLMLALNPIRRRSDVLSLPTAPVVAITASLKLLARPSLGWPGTRHLHLTLCILSASSVLGLVQRCTHLSWTDLATRAALIDLITRHRFSAWRTGTSVMCSPRQQNLVG